MTTGEQTQPSANPADAQDTDRQQQLEALFTRNYGFIKDVALSDKRLLVFDGERITKGVIEHLHLYDGPLEDEPFQEWAAEIIRPAVSRLSQVYRIREQCSDRMIYAAIRDVLNGANLGEDDKVIRDLIGELWTWLFFKLDPFLSSESTASISTRLYARARWIARAWKTKQLRQRQKLAGLDANGELEAADRKKATSKRLQPLLIPEATKNATSELVSDTPVRIKQESIDLNIKRPSKMFCISCGELIQAVSSVNGSVQLACGHIRPQILPTKGISFESLNTPLGKQLFPSDKAATKSAEPVPCI